MTHEQTPESSKISGTPVENPPAVSFTGLSWAEASDAAAAKLLTDAVSVDLARLTERGPLEKVVPSLPPQKLFYALKEQGIEENRDVLFAATQEQLQRILDYDGWSQDRLRLARAANWLKPFRLQSERALFERYSALDEEVQISLLSGKVAVFDEEEVEKLSHAEKSDLVSLPGGELWYRITTEEEHEAEFIHDLVESCLAGRVEYALSLLAHAHHAVPNEPEAMASQFRRARLEEDGFASFEESIEILYPFDFSALKKKWERGEVAATDSVVVTAEEAQAQSVNFLDLARRELTRKADKSTVEKLSAIETSLVFVANNLCSALNIEAGDIAGLRKSLLQTRALVGLGLEFLSQQNVELACEILATEPPKVLFRLAITLITLVRDKAIDRLEQKGLDVARMRRLRHQGKYLEIADIIEEILEGRSLVLAETYRGLFNTLPMRPIFESQPAGDDKSETKAKIRFAPIESLQELNELTSLLDALLEDGFQNRTVH